MRALEGAIPSELLFAKTQAQYATTKITCKHSLHFWCWSCSNAHSMNSAPPSAQGTLPWRPLWIFAAVYALAWTLLPAWLGNSFALDVVESLSWGKEWEWGYYKHPPLAPWVLNAFYLALGKFGPYLLSQLCIGLTLWAVWCTGRRLMDPLRALLGTVLTLGVAYYNFPAVEFNHNIAQMPV